MNKFKVGVRDPLFFLHIPKTAGMSMRGYLQNEYFQNDIYPPQSWAEAVKTSFQPKAFRLVQGHFYYNMRQALQPEAKVVAILRNPLLRTVSALRHLQRDAEFHRDHALTRGLTLTQIIRNPGLLGRQANVQAAALCASVPPDQVLDYLRRTLPTEPGAEAGNLEEAPTLALALERLDKIEFLGTTEQLGLLLREMGEAMQFHPSLDLPLINGAPEKRTDLAEFSPEDIERLEQCNQIDLPIYARAQAIIAQRQFTSAMLNRIASGVYTRPRGPFVVDLRDPVPGTGWYRPESSGPQHWRWTGPEADFTVELPMQLDVGYKLDMRFSSPRPLEQGLRLRANGLDIDFEIQQDGASTTVQATIPKSLLASSAFCCRLVVSTGQTARIAQSAGDLRLLGVAVNRLEFSPVG